ncbi:MAG: DoxX family protein [Gemmatimonadota bacterium]|nr:DoxX family protein [Gemmatimonadota bacterium]
MAKTRSDWGKRIAWAFVVLITGLEVLTMGDAGLSKFQSMDGWMYWFARFGYPPRMALLVGAVEFVGAGLLLIPRLASYASIILSIVMLGALEAVLTTETDLGWFDPVLHLAFLGIIGAFHWKRRWRRLGSRGEAQVVGEGR